MAWRRPTTSHYPFVHCVWISLCIFWTEQSHLKTYEYYINVDRIGVSNHRLLNLTVRSTDCLGKNQRQRSWPFVRGIHRWPKASYAENISMSWRYHDIFHWSTHRNMHPFKSHPIIKKAVGPMLVQRWHTTIGVTLRQRWTNVSVPTLGRCWSNVGPTLVLQRWADVGPT